MSINTHSAIAAADDGKVLTEIVVTYFDDKYQARAAQVVLVLRALAAAEAHQVAEVARALQGMGVRV
ncbi:MAG: hypothetical protein RL268_502 [Pseudomonadota bacterium]|jgi:hypothetical protein